MYREEQLSANEEDAAVGESDESVDDEVQNDEELANATVVCDDAALDEKTGSRGSQAYGSSSYGNGASVQSSYSKGTKRTRVHSGDQRVQSPVALEEMFLCRVCMDRTIDSVLLKCGHVVCCMSCAEQLSTCPVCRQDAPVAHKLFLPIGHCRMPVIK